MILRIKTHFIPLKSDLFGPPHVFWLRIHAEVYTVDTTKRLLEIGDLKTRTADYVVPESRSFIPNMPEERIDEKPANKKFLSAADVQ